MYNIFINLTTHVMNWSKEDYDGRRSSIREYAYSKDLFSDSNFDDLKSKVIRAKGDWLNIDRRQFKKNHYIDIELVWTYGQQKDEVVNLVDQSITRFFEDSAVIGSYNNYDNFDELFELINEDGEIIFISEECGSISLIDKTINVLSENKVDYNLLEIDEQESECGASGGLIAFAFFIGESVLGGMTYDSLKIAIRKAIGGKHANIRAFRTNAKNIQKVKSNVAKILGEDKKDIILSDMNVLDDEVIFLFSVKSKKVNITFDSNMNIINLITESINH